MPLRSEESAAADGDADGNGLSVEVEVEPSPECPRVGPSATPVLEPVMPATERPATRKGSPKKMQLKDGRKVPLQERGLPEPAPLAEGTGEAPFEDAGALSPSSSSRLDDPRTPSPRRGRPPSRPLSQ